jgi:stalled ribosome rescue protein Dom34
MSVKHKKQFGVWLDTRHATVIGFRDPQATEFSVLAHVENSGAGSNSSENAANNREKTLLHQYFKEITRHMQNADEIHLTGTGTIQEQFTHYLADTPQFKNTLTTESTSNKMSDESLLEYVAAQFS